MRQLYETLQTGCSQVAVKDCFESCDVRIDTVEKRILFMTEYYHWLLLLHAGCHHRFPRLVKSLWHSRLDFRLFITLYWLIHMLCNTLLLMQIFIYWSTDVQWRNSRYNWFQSVYFQCPFVYRSWPIEERTLMAHYFGVTLKYSFGEINPGLTERISISGYS